MNTEKQTSLRTEQELTSAFIAAALEGHRVLGTGLPGKVYERALCYEMGLRGISFECQRPIPIVYQDVFLGDGLRLGLIVNFHAPTLVKGIHRVLSASVFNSPCN